MPDLSDAGTRDAIVARIARLDASSQPRWGRMNVGQMVVHCGLQLKLALGELDAVRKPHPVAYFPLKQLLIYVLPVPKGVPTLPEIRDPLTGDWQADRDTLRTLVARFAALPDGRRMPAHPAFGELTRRQWSLLAWKHLDHHLRQF